MLALQGLPQFSELPPTQLAELAGAASWVTVLAGESLEVDGLVLVRPGEALGIAALFDSSSVIFTAHEKTRVLTLLRDDLRRTVEDNPEIALGLCRVLVRR
jgi:CRP-like cAMP-binding protein